MTQRPNIVVSLRKSLRNMNDASQIQVRKAIITRKGQDGLKNQVDNEIEGVRIQVHQIIHLFQTPSTQLASSNRDAATIHISTL